MTHMLYGARALAEWILEGGRPERPAFAHSARLRWHAYWFEHNWRTQSERLSALALPQDPVFIIGPWRSGTTVLHELVAASTEWPTPQTWQCFNPSSCFLVPSPPRESMTERPMDAGLISSRGPQEDEFAALLLGEDSVYRSFIDPRRLRECGAALWQSAREGPADTERLPRWQAFVRGIAAEAPDRRLLLKSPNHTFRLPLLRRCFPRAQFVWIGRHSAETLASNLKMWRAMMGRYAHWSCPAGLLETFLGDVLRACADVLSRCLDEMSPEQLLWVDFAALHSEPRLVLRAVLDFLQPGAIDSDSERERQLDAALQRTSVHAGSRTLAASDSNTERLDRLMVAARQHFGERAVARRKSNR